MLSIIAIFIPSTQDELIHSMSAAEAVVRKIKVGLSLFLLFVLFHGLQFEH